MVILKVVFKNVSLGYKKIRQFLVKFKQITTPFSKYYKKGIIYKCAKKNLAKILEGHYFFFVKCRRNYVIGLGCK